jgi:hypothetical protein
MNRLDIIRMARDAGCLLPGKGGDPNGLWEPNGWENVTDLMFKFAALVAAHERERLVQVSPLEFVTAVLEKEHLIGKPIMWAQWPNEEKNT